MSTSTVYECRDSYMNQINSHLRSSSTVDRKAVGGPVDNSRSRKCSNSSVLPPQYLRMNSAHQSSNVVSLASSNNLRFDRSLSEPSDTRLASSQNQLSHINSNKYKTELCRSYDESRQCKYGEKCRYAHGSTELRTPARHPKYKTEPCRTYHSSGFCPYGPRCHFIHNEYERKNPQSSSNSGSNSPTNLNSANVVNDDNILNANSSNSNMSPHSPNLPLFHTQISSTGNSFANSNTTSNLNFSMRSKSVKFNSTSSSSLGSAADSPPSSVTDSPTLSLSPLFFGDEFQGFNSAYTSSSSPSSNSPSSTPLSSSSSSISISGLALDGLLGCTTNSLSNALDLLTISECSTHDLSTNRFHLEDNYLIDLETTNFQNGSYFTEPSIASSKLSSALEWTFGGLSDYDYPILQASE